VSRRAKKKSKSSTAPTHYAAYKRRFSEPDLIADLRQRHCDVVWRARWGRSWVEKKAEK
jgi:hypothetical protein